MKKVLFCLILVLTYTGNAYSEETAAKSEKPLGKVWFIKPAEGARVKNPITFCFEASKELKVVKWSKTHVQGEGHHHLLIDVDFPKRKSLKGLKRPIKMIHQSSGTSCKTIKKPLSIGKHVVSGLFTQNDHNPYEPIITTSVHIEVVK